MTFNRERVALGTFCLLLILGFMFYVFVCAPVSPLREAPAGSIAGEKIPADGYWGQIGFWRNPTDNNNTYFLLTLFCVTAIGKTVKVCFLKKREGLAESGFQP